MKKIGIITIIDNNNCGNRLQNYALQEVLKKKDFNVTTIKNNKFFNNKGTIKYRIILLLKYIRNTIHILKNRNKMRNECFKDFNKNIKFSNKTFSIYSKNINKDYDFFIVGSDQVWKPTYLRLSDIDLLNFADKEKRISFAASFGISELPVKYTEKTKKELKCFKAISVRECAGKKIVEDLTGRTDIEVIIDPTMLLDADEWDKVSKKPKGMKNNEKYILTYFLGNTSIDRKNEIERIAKENNCIIINLLDKKDDYYKTGPAEFLYLEKHAFLICTDSFHSSVFSILYNVPVIIYKREDNLVNMNSRIETLVEKFKIEDRVYKGKIDEKLLKCNYNEGRKILNLERNKANEFLEKAINN